MSSCLICVLDRLPRVGADRTDEASQGFQLAEMGDREGVCRGIAIALVLDVVVSVECGRPGVTIVGVNERGVTGKPLIHPGTPLAESDPWPWFRGWLWLWLRRARRVSVRLRRMLWLWNRLYGNHPPDEEPEIRQHLPGYESEDGQEHEGGGRPPGLLWLGLVGVVLGQSEDPSCDGAPAADDDRGR